MNLKRVALSCSADKSISLLLTVLIPKEFDFGT